MRERKKNPNQQRREKEIMRKVNKDETIMKIESVVSCGVAAGRNWG